MMDVKNLIGSRLLKATLALTIAATASLVHIATPDRAVAQIQQTPDSARYLINRFVPPNEQWAISYNFEDLTLTGNVFKTDGGEPSFIWCQFTDIDYSENPSDNAYTLTCFGSDACSEAPCTPAQWTEIAAGIPLPASFLLPPGTTATFGGNVQPVFNASCAFSGCHGGATPAAGLDLGEGVAYANIFERESNQSDLLLVMPFSPEDSYLYRKIMGTGSLGSMPPGGPLSNSQIAAINAWITEGAADN